MSKKALKMEPLADLVLIEEREAESASGLVLPEKISAVSRASVYNHYVVAVGPDVKDISPGDRVILRPRANSYLTERGSPRVLVHREDILARVVA